jgi:hypothetical protein
LGNDDDVATGDALRSGILFGMHLVNFARDSGSMLSGISLLQGSHQGRNCS